MIVLQTLPDDANRPAKAKTYIAIRNQIVAESFGQIQEFIDEQKVDRKSLKLIRCKAQAVQKKNG